MGAIVAACMIGYAANQGVRLPPKIGVWGTMIGAAIGWVIGSFIKPDDDE